MVRLLVAFAVVVVMVGLFFVLRPDPRAAGSRERTFEVFVEDGGMVPRELRVEVGDRAVVVFEAGLAGRFGIEDHRSEREVGVLAVGPR